MTTAEQFNLGIVRELAAEMCELNYAATVYPRVQKISINGFKYMSFKEAIPYMREAIKQRRKQLLQDKRNYHSFA